ncbi:V-type proton ATPase subunit C-like [Centruroides sculpturatus]|uniref:V-type proton ATPase subunit C-like n=1 Tax=Centruroides sculpturatus TaxID=218467 RepID=UPI000C6E521D|nr:V-type proton ATPase subunit C-like [Centruroides sculpturatus]
MTEFWLISAPGEKSCQQTFETLNNLTSKHNNLSVNYKFDVPDLKVGTLDQLVGLSDDLDKLDLFVEGVTWKLANYLGDVLEDKKDKLAENLLINNAPLAEYLTRFKWIEAKYPTKQPLPSITEIISKQISQIDADLKKKSSDYNNIKTNILKEKIGQSRTQSSITAYHKILIYEDGEHGLFNVTLFIKDVEEFKRVAREKRFSVRDFTYSEEELAKGKNALAQLESDKKKQYSQLVRWLKVNFSEAFTAWIHVKALRVFVESVLRYGLPVNFQAMLLKPNKKTMRKLREVLNHHYSHLDTSIAQGPIDDIPGINLGHQEYYPYVYFKININILEGLSR